MALVYDALRRKEQTISPTSAVLITSAFFAVAALAWAVNPPAAKLLIAITIAGTSVWAALDSWRLKAQEYPSQVSAHPFVLFTALLVLWVVVFPVYLVVRSRIRAGLLQRTVNPQGRRPLYFCIALWCVPFGLKLLAWFASKNLAGLP